MSRPSLSRTLTIALALVASLAWTVALAPSAVAQSAGDEQYADPLAGEGDQSPPPPAQDSPSDAAPAAPAPDAVPAEEPPAASAPATGSASPDGSVLPRTGADAALLAVLGLGLAALGSLLRMRTGSRALR